MMSTSEAPKAKPIVHGFTILSHLLPRYGISPPLENLAETTH
jgi:hypothetical protein